MSVLSNLSIGAASTTSATPSKQFSIEGLDHTLLSRGTGSSTAGASTSSTGYGGGGSKANKKAAARKDTDRRQKRRERQMARGVGPGDVFGMRRESALCDELW